MKCDWANTKKIYIGVVAIKPYSEVEYGHEVVDVTDPSNDNVIFTIGGVSIKYEIWDMRARILLITKDFEIAKILRRVNLTLGLRVYKDAGSVRVPRVVREVYEKFGLNTMTIDFEITGIGFISNGYM